MQTLKIVLKRDGYKEKEYVLDNLHDAYPKRKMIEAAGDAIDNFFSEGLEEE